MINETVTFFGKKYRISTLNKSNSRLPFHLYAGITWNAYSTHSCGTIGTAYTPQQAVTRLESNLLKEFRKLAKVCGYEVSE